MFNWMKSKKEPTMQYLWDSEDVENVWVKVPYEYAGICIRIKDYVKETSDDEFIARMMEIAQLDWKSSDKELPQLSDNKTFVWVIACVRHPNYSSDKLKFNYKYEVFKYNPQMGWQSHCPIIQWAYFNHCEFTDGE